MNFFFSLARGKFRTLLPGPASNLRVGVGFARGIKRNSCVSLSCRVMYPHQKKTTEISRLELGVQNSSLGSSGRTFGTWPEVNFYYFFVRIVALSSRTHGATFG